MDYLISFLIGGLICAAAQILLDRTKLMPGVSWCCWCVRERYLGSAGYTSLLRNFAHSGATVPLLGFGNTLWQGVKEAVDENGFIGIFMGGFKASAVGISAR